MAKSKIENRKPEPRDQKTQTPEKKQVRKISQNGNLQKWKIRGSTEIEIARNGNLKKWKSLEMESSEMSLPKMSIHQNGTPQNVSHQMSLPNISHCNPVLLQCISSASPMYFQCSPLGLPAMKDADDDIAWGWCEFPELTTNFLWEY